MPIPFDLDLPIYLWSTLKVLFGSKTRLRQNTKPIPVRFEFEELSESQLTAAQLEYLKPFDLQLARLNYRPLCTFRARNYGANLLRRYMNSADAASCALTVVEVKASVNGVVCVRNSSYVEFATRLSNGDRFTTRNMAQKSLFDQPPYRITQDFLNVTDLAELKRRHDARAQSLGATDFPPQDFASVSEELTVEHERYAKFQLENGVYQLAPAGDAYLVTDKVFNRGIRNHFLPFSRRISLSYAIFSALIGALLPLFGILKIGPWLAVQSSSVSNGQIHVAALGILAAYCLAGAVIGRICQYQKFTWFMLIIYVPAHLVAGWTFGWFPYTTAAYVCAYLASQSRERAKLVLQS
jgi:hypothetical protein